MHAEGKALKTIAVELGVEPVKVTIWLKKPAKKKGK
jgi:hypothetical protein